MADPDHSSAVASPGLQPVDLRRDGRRHRRRAGGRRSRRRRPRRTAPGLRRPLAARLVEVPAAQAGDGRRHRRHRDLSRRRFRRFPRALRARRATAPRYTYAPPQALHLWDATDDGVRSACTCTATRCRWIPPASAACSSSTPTVKIPVGLLRRGIALQPVGPVRGTASPDWSHRAGAADVSCGAPTGSAATC